MSKLLATHRQEIQELQALIAERRNSGVRPRFPESLKARIRMLRKAGISARALAAELGLAGSQVYEWCSQASIAPPQVFHVDPSPTPQMERSSAPAQELQLVVGKLRITIAIAGA